MLLSAVAVDGCVAGVCSGVHCRSCWTAGVCSLGGKSPWRDERRATSSRVCGIRCVAGRVVVSSKRAVRVIALSERVGFVLKHALRSGRGSVQACFRERLDA